MSRSYHEELARGLARSFLRRCLRKSVGWQGGASGNGGGRKRRGSEVRRKHWQSEQGGGAGLAAFSKPVYFSQRDMAQV